MNENSKKFFNKIKNKKFLEILFVVLLSIIILVIFLSTINSDKTKEEYSFNEYVTRLENKLESVLKTVDKVGKVSVVINISSTPETIFVMETTTTENSSGIKTVTTPVIVGGEVVVLREEMPKITGVLIVAEGANNLLVKSKLINSTSTLLNVEPEKIEILTMK